MPRVPLGGRISEPGQRCGYVRLGLGRVIAVMMLWPFWRRQRCPERFDANQGTACLACVAQPRPGPPFLRSGLDIGAAVVGGDPLRGLSKPGGLPVLPGGEYLPRVTLQAPCGDLGMACFAREARSRPQVRRCGVVFVQVDEAGCCEQGQPATRDEQAAMLA